MTDLKAEFGRWLAETRKRAGLSQAAAAKAAELTPAQWSRIETGVSGTRRETIPRIAAAIRADLQETYRRSGYAPCTAQGDASEIDEGLLRDLEGMIAQVPPHRRKPLCDAIRHITEAVIPLLSNHGE